MKALLGVDSEENASSKRRLSDAFTTSGGSSGVFENIDRND